MASLSIDINSGYVGKLTSTALEVSHTDSFIVGGWFEPTTSSVNPASIMGKGENQGFSSHSNLSYSIRLTAGGSVQFKTRISSTSDASITANEGIALNTSHFILAWVNASTGDWGIQIDDNEPATGIISLTAFTDDGAEFRIGRTNATFGFSGRPGYRDEWFFCKNPPDFDAALLVAQFLYNDGLGLNYASLTNDMKTTLGLVSWWGLDEASGTRFDSHGNEDLDLNAPIISQGPSLVTGSIIYLALNDSVSSNDLRFLEPNKNLSDSSTLTDDLENILNRVLQENLSLEDSFRTSPLLAPLNDLLLISDWLTIKRDTSQSGWFD